jgi:hypothetical protein
MGQTSNKDLGPMIATYRDRPLRWRDLLVTFLPAVLAVLAPLAYGIWRTYYGLQKYGLAAAKAWGPPWFALSSLALIALLMLALVRVRRAHRIVSVHQDGLYIQHTGGRKHTLQWGEIRSIRAMTFDDTFLGKKIRTRHRTLLGLQEGKTIRLDSSINNLAELTSRIKAKIYPRLLRQLRLELEAREELYFGPVTINRDRLRFEPGRLREAKQLAWRQVRNITIRNGRLVIDSHNDNPLSVPVNRIPNLELLIQLINEGVEA